MVQEVIAIVNGKGGVGKTPTAVALAYTYARAGKSVLFEDVDQQGTGSYHFLGLKYKVHTSNLYMAIKEKDLSEKVPPVPVRVSRFPGTPEYERYISLLAANENLANAEVDLPKDPTFLYQLHLAKLNKKYYQNYDIIIIDTPGSHISIFTIMALTAATKVLVPVKTELPSVEGTVDSISLIEDVQEGLNPGLKLWGILPTQHESGNRHHAEALTLLHTYFPDSSVSSDEQKYYPVYRSPSLKRNHYNLATENRCDVREVSEAGRNTIAPGAVMLGEYWDELAYDLLKYDRAPIDEDRMATILANAG